MNWIAATVSIVGIWAIGSAAMAQEAAGNAASTPNAEASAAGAEADILSRYTDMITPYVPIFTYLADYEGDLTEADLEGLDASPEVISDAQRIFAAVQAARSQMNQEALDTELDVEDPELAQDIGIGIQIGLALDELHGGEAGAAESDAEGTMESDWLGDAVKIATVIALL